MKTSDFYKILNEYNNLFKEYGFKRKKNAYVTDNDVSLKFLQDKWGWDEEYGASFMIRLFDDKQVDEYGNVLNYALDTLDIFPETLIKNKLLEHNDFKKIYAGYPPKLFERIDSAWYSYYDSKHLRQLLNAILRPILIVGSDWASNREVERSKPRPPRKKRTKAEIEKIRREAEDVLDQITKEAFGDS